jgi:MFS family permease
VIAEVIASGSFNTKFNNPSEDHTGLIVSLFTAGAFLGAGLAGPSGDWIGRRWTIGTGAFIFTVGGSLQTSAENISFLWGGRFLAGVGCANVRIARVTDQMLTSPASVS